MNDKEIGKELYDKALDFINERFPSGWGGCAIMYTLEKETLISVALESFNASACLCMETGAMCEAQKYNYKITHSICVSRENEFEGPKVLTACGTCLERLRYWGEDVKVGIGISNGEIVFKTISELQPNYWGNCFNGEREEYKPGIIIDKDLF